MNLQILNIENKKNNIMTPEETLTVKFDTNNQYNVAKKNPDNSRLQLSDRPRIGSLGSSIKAIFVDCMNDSSIMGLPNISKENSHIGK